MSVLFNDCLTMMCNSPPDLPISQVIQTTAKASLAGKQWLLSSFAPFEGEPDLPNFIEDQAFEEVRSEFYAARTTNTEHLAKQKFNQAWTHAQELTMKMINQDQTVMAYLVDTFGVKRKSSSSTTNPNTVNQQPGTFGMPGTGSVFGTSTNTSFGAPVPGAITGGGGSIFGGTGTVPQQNANGGSIFGGGQTTVSQATSGGSIFGGSPAAAPIPPGGGSIFGQPAAAGGGSIFGGANSPASGGSIFGGSPAVGTIPSTGASIFGQPAPAHQSSGNIFGQSQQPGIFGGGAVQQPATAELTQGANIFGQSVFGGSAPIQQQQSQPAAMGNIFGQSQQAPTNVFQQQQIPEQPSIFSQPQQQVPQQGAPPPNPFQNASPFASAPNQSLPAATGADVFGNLAQNANQAAQASIFGPSASQAGGGNASRGGVAEDSYSRTEELSSEVLDIFKADEPFELGKIPNVAPPRVLC